MSVSKADVRRWRSDPALFISEAVRVPDRSGRARAPELWEIQRGGLELIGAPDAYGRWPHRTIWLCWPRRVGKSSLSRWLALWSFALFPGRDVWFVSTSRESTHNQQFVELRRDVERSPRLRELVESTGRTELTGVLGSRCTLLPYKPESAVGIKVDCAVLSECWAMGDTSMLDALLPGTATCDGMVLLDSTAPPEGSAWERLLQEPLPEMFVNWRTGLDTYKLTPISESTLAAMQRTMSPSEWRSKILNEVVAAELSRLWNADQIAQAQRSYPVPITCDQLRELFAHELECPSSKVSWRTYIGLDRALGAAQSDASIASAICVAYANGKRRAVLADQRELDGSDGDAIAQSIAEMAKRYGSARAFLETFSTVDVCHMLKQQGVRAELVHPTAKAQAEAFPRLYSALVSGEFVFSTELSEFAAELAAFGHDPIKGRYGGLAKGKAGGVSDDRVYSVVWPLSAAFEHAVSAGGFSSGVTVDLPIEEMLSESSRMYQNARVMGSRLDW